jgi:hypothetical protein
MLNTNSFADTLVLKNGLKLEGQYKGGTATTIKFETSGAIQEIAVSEVKSISFSAPTTTAPAAVPQKTTAALGTAPSGTEIPVGTKVKIITTDAISTAKHKKGSIFTAEIESDVLLNGQIVIPKASKVYGTVVESIGGRRIGKQRIVVNFNKIKLNNQDVAIVTDDLGAEGGRGGAAKMIGAGAIFGAAGGNAGKGATIGAGMALLAGGKHIQIPPNSLVEIDIKEAITIP